MTTNIVFDIRARSLGTPQAPDCRFRGQSNTPDGVALRSRWSLVPAHPRRKYGARPALIGGLVKSLRE